MKLSERRLDDFFQKNSFQCRTTQNYPRKSTEDFVEKATNGITDAQEDRLSSDNNILYTLLMKSEEFIRDDYLKEVDSLIINLREMSFGQR